MSGPFVDNSKRDWKWWFYHFKSAFAVLLSLAVLIGGGYGIYRVANKAYYEFRTTEDYIGTGVDPVQIVVPDGASGTDIGNLLLQKDVIKSMKAYLKATDDLPEGKTIQAGKYNLKTQMPAASALAVLTEPKNRVVTRVTIPEGQTIAEFLPTLSKGSGVPVAQLQAAAKNTKALGLPAYATKGAEGFLFPDTYEVPDKPTGPVMLKLMSTRYNAVAKEINFEARAKGAGLTPLQAVTVASIAEKEVNNPDDMKMVAGIIQNRLKAGMPLQLDSTVIYGLGIPGRLTTTDKERADPNPYNTYVHKGLPPGPISNPGKNALEASVNPTPSDFLFWVVINPDTGETAFSKTFAEHQANVNKFVAWCQANKGKC